MKTIYHQFRNVMHVVGFFTLAYKGLGLLDLDLWTWQKIVLGFVLSAIGYGLGHGYEGLRNIFFGDKVSNSDGNLSWIWIYCWDFLNFICAKHRVYKYLFILFLFNFVCFR
jgi:hypothetical protein